MWLDEFQMLKMILCQGRQQVLINRRRVAGHGSHETRDEADLVLADRRRTYERFVALLIGDRPHETRPDW